MEELEFAERSLWRNWLSVHHVCEGGVWLVFHRKHTGVASLDYGASVEEALCFGWIDSIIRRLDEGRYARKFTPRKKTSVWSDPNKQRAARMIEAGQMTGAGMALIEAAKASGEWEQERARPRVDAHGLPEELAAGLAANAAAQANFTALAPTYRKQYVLWIATAKRAETRQRRSAEAVQMLARGERMGLK
jgi:uncharacterized protein YdeI (YjbR/CyaY-like superfamily)